MHTSSMASPTRRPPSHIGIFVTRAWSGSGYRFNLLDPRPEMRPQFDQIAPRSGVIVRKEFSQAIEASNWSRKILRSANLVKGPEIGFHINTGRGGLWSVET